MAEQQNICLPVGAELGTPPDPSMIAEFDETFREIAALETTARVYTEEDLATGEAAARAIRDLGCASCELSGVCVTGQELEQQVEIGAANKEVLDKVSMLSSAPAWLVAGRLNRANTDMATLSGQISNLETTKENLANGSLDIDNLMGGATNNFVGMATKQNTPELADKTSIPDQAVFPSIEVKTNNGATFTVIDASEVLEKGSGTPTVDEKSYGVLTGKLLQRMTEVGADGKPQITSPDNTMQKKLKHSSGHSTIYELRMNGKNRMYFELVDTGNNTYRMMILGAHGGNANTQDTYIHHISR